MAEKKMADLAGTYVLQAVAYGKDGNGLFTLNGTTYEAVCDEDDGYRSYLECLKIVDTIPKQYDVPVLIVYVDDAHDTRIEITDVRNGELVLEVGTKDLDDYYPSYLFRYTPENIYENKEEVETDGQEGT